MTIRELKKVIEGKPLDQEIIVEMDLGRGINGVRLTGDGYCSVIGRPIYLTTLPGLSDAVLKVRVEICI